MPEERLLDPSWTRVERFDPAGPSSRSQKTGDAMNVDEERSDSEWEYEETEEMVTLDLGPESKRLYQMSHQYSITGLESNNPYFRIGSVLFKGHWDQLLGTEIILRDEKDATKSTSFQHDFQPLPATQTDLKTGRAPSTARHRIQFKPAVNIAARERALKDPANPNKVVNVKYKGGWIWKKGKGWIKKDQVNLFDIEDGVEEGEDVDNREDVEEEEKEVEVGSVAPKIKTGRKKMTDEEKMRQSIWTSLKKIDRLKNEGEQGRDPAEGSSAEVEESNSRNLSPDDAGDDYGEGEEQEDGE